MQPLDEANLWLQIYALIKEQEEAQKRLEALYERETKLEARIAELERELGIDQPES